MKIITEQHRKNLSKALKGRKLTKEHCEAMSKANKGKTISIETRKAISIALTGIKRNPFSKEHRAKIFSCRMLLEM